MNKPLTMRYPNHCDKCQPLGQFQKYDIYWCDQGVLSTIFIRYGESRIDYTRGIYAANIPVFKVAKAMAESAGLIPREG